ncbi:MAG: hypothetical protein MHPSP_003704, partial [Paramarteilia canceri]
ISKDIVSKCEALLKILVNKSGIHLPTFSTHSILWTGSKLVLVDLSRARMLSKETRQCREEEFIMQNEKLSKQLKRFIKPIAA